MTGLTQDAIGWSLSRDQEAAVGAEVHVIDAAAGHLHGLDHLHGRWIQEVQPRLPFGDDDGELAGVAF